MPIRITDFRVPVERPEAELPIGLARAVGVEPADLTQWRILRKSLDTRDKRQLQFVYSAEMTLGESEASALEKARARGLHRVEAYAEPPYDEPAPGSEPMPGRPVVVGSGPGGLICAYVLAQHGYRPILLERGTPVSQRIKDVKGFDAGGAFEPESNYLFGEGGAGTFSDGKLTCRGSGPDVAWVLELFATHKGKPSIVYEHRPHLGSNRLPAVVKAIRQAILDMGGEVRFHCKVEDLEVRGGRVAELATTSGPVPCGVAVVATGHSARDTYEMLLRRGVTIVPKEFQIGVRVEHPQALVNRVQYGPKPHENLLGNADYSLVAKGGKADVFTFCMCAGGHVIPSVSREGYFATNGMSLSKRDSYWANSGLVVTLPASEFGAGDPLAGVRVQEKYEKLAFEAGRGEYRCPVQRVGDFLAGRPSSGKVPSSYPRDTVAHDLAKLLPPYIVEALKAGMPKLDRTWRGQFIPEGVLVGPEARGSSPVRIARDHVSRESPSVAGIYPVGEGAGYAGGIVSAAVDGLKTARAIVNRYARV